VVSVLADLDHIDTDFLFHIALVLNRALHAISACAFALPKEICMLMCDFIAECLSPDVSGQQHRQSQNYAFHIPPKKSFILAKLQKRLRQFSP
jgi:hypothetical protein